MRKSLDAEAEVPTKANVEMSKTLVIQGGASKGLSGDVTAPATMSLAEAANVLGIHRTTAWSLYKRGQLPVPVLKVGSSLRVVRVHLERFLETGDPVKPRTLVRSPSSEGG